MKNNKNELNPLFILFSGIFGRIFGIIIGIIVCLLFGIVGIFLIVIIFLLLNFLLKKKIKSEKICVWLCLIISIIVYIFVLFCIGFYINYTSEVEFNPVSTVKITLSTHGFNITYFSNWQPKENLELEHTILSLQRVEEFDGLLYKLGSVTVKDYYNDGITQEEMIEVYTNGSFTKELEEHSLIDTIEITLTQINGVTIPIATYFETIPNYYNEITGVTEDLRMKVRSYLIVKDNETILGIHYAAYTDTYDIYLEEAEEIINSFKLKKI